LLATPITGPDSAVRALPPLAFGLAIIGAGWSLAAAPTSALRPGTATDPGSAAAELRRARIAGREASERAVELERAAQSAGEAAGKAAREAAALAARIQLSEAEIATARATAALATARREALAARLAERREPLVRLTAALQTNARRPLMLAAFQPGTLEDLVHVRAVLASAVPYIRRRTAALSKDLETSERLERRTAAALDNLAASEARWEGRRRDLAALEARARLASRAARNSSARERERALMLAEEARDLDGLIDQLDADATLRRELAALPGPVLRPADGRPARTASPAPLRAEPTTQSAPLRYRLPVAGRTLAGFGAVQASGLPATALTLAPQSQAQIVAPAAGRIAFAEAYSGYGRIVIIEHRGGWTSLVTGLARTAVTVGEEVIAGAPLGTAGTRDPAIGIELRHDGKPVNPLDYLR
jgi:septal ring factor EnvC (AmiA/AmiB activator)